MKIYIMHIGCIYEGGGTASIHKTYDGALKAAEKSANEYLKTRIEGAALIGRKSTLGIEEVQDGFQVDHTEFVVYDVVLKD